MGLQDDYDRAKSWSCTMRALAQLTPLIKQFPWLINLVQKLPSNIIRPWLPNLARVVFLIRVSRPYREGRQGISIPSSLEYQHC